MIGSYSKRCNDGKNCLEKGKPKILIKLHTQYLEYYTEKITGKCFLLNEFMLPKYVISYETGTELLPFLDVLVTRAKLHCLQKNH